MSKVLNCLLSALLIRSLLATVSVNNPAQNFNLSVWKLQLPVDSNNKFIGSPAEVYPITSTYTNYPYFYSANDNAMVFYAPYNGVTTSNSIHPRSELREMTGPYMTLSGRFWDMYQVYSSFTATLAVNQLALLNTGSWATVVIGQIHAPTGEQVRLYFQSSGQIFWSSSPPTGTSCSSINNVYLYSSTNAKSSIPLNSKFSYNIQTNTTHLLVYVTYDGVVYSSVRKFDVCWTGTNVGAYYKAGCYCQVNNVTGKYDGTGACQVSFYTVSQPILSKTRFASGPLFPSTNPTTVAPSSKLPTNAPSSLPSVKPSTQTAKPSFRPSSNPTTRSPTSNPVTRAPTKSPFKPSKKPTKAPN